MGTDDSTSPERDRASSGTGDSPVRSESRFMLVGDEDPLAGASLPPKYEPEDKDSATNTVSARVPPNELGFIDDLVDVHPSVNSRSELLRRVVQQMMAVHGTEVAQRKEELEETRRSFS